MDNLRSIIESGALYSTDAFREAVEDVVASRIHVMSGKASQKRSDSSVDATVTLPITATGTDPWFTVGSNQLTIRNAGSYDVSASCSIDFGGSHGTIALKMQVGSVTYDLLTYSRPNTNMSATLTGSALRTVQVSANTVVKFVAVYDYISSPMKEITQSIEFSIKNL